MFDEIKFNKNTAQILLSDVFQIVAFNVMSIISASLCPVLLGLGCTGAWLSDYILSIFDKQKNSNQQYYYGYKNYGCNQYENIELIISCLQTQVICPPIFFHKTKHKPSTLTDSLAEMMFVACVINAIPMYVAERLGCPSIARLTDCATVHQPACIAPNTDYAKIVIVTQNQRQEDRRSQIIAVFTA